MSSFAQQLIAGLHEAAAGDFTRFTIQGQVWVRHYVGSPEHQLSEARSAIADMTTEIDVLRSERDELRGLIDGLLESGVLDKAIQATQSVNNETTGLSYALTVWGEDARAALEKKGDGGDNGEQIAKADKIVTALYRRFKDWSKRGFGPDDVTWCEVKSDVVELINASQAGEAIDLRAKLATVTAKRDAALEVLEFIRAHYDDEVMQRVDAALEKKGVPNE